MKKKESLSIFLAYLIYTALLAYFSLAVISISDKQIIINKNVTLPIFNIDIALNAFFFTVPLLAVFFFVCFQLYIHKMRTFFDDSKSGLFRRSYEIMTSFILWGTLPLFLIFVAFKYVKTHEPVLSYVIGSAPIMGTLVVLRFLRKFDSLSQKKSFRRMTLRILFVSSVIVVELFLLIFLIPCAREGLFPKTIRRNAGRFLNNIAFVNLSHQKLITEPKKDFNDIPWGNFKEIHMEGAFLRHVLLKRAHLKGAFLQNSQMQFAVLEGADLSFANLLQANLWNADLKGTNLSHAYLLGARLRKANFQRANLRGANLQYTQLYLANFQEADLSLADIQFADLWTVNFQGANFSHANLQEISLQKSNLAETDFKDANLQRVNLWKANLRGANFEGADLRGAEGLEIEQLAEVKTLYKAKLDLLLMKQVAEKHPHLLRKPEEKK